MVQKVNSDLVKDVELTHDSVAETNSLKVWFQQIYTFMKTLGKQFITSTGSTTGRNLEDRFADTVNVKDFGAVGDGLTDDTAAIQAAIDAAGKKVVFPTGTYAISQTIGINDTWGILVNKSNLILEGQGSTIIRTNTNLTNEVDCYSPLFVGVPDSNDSNDRIENITIKDFTFIGSDQRHTLAGNTPSDRRNAVEFKNTKNTTVEGCSFENIDSSAIWYQQAYFQTDRARGNVRYNNTKNVDSTITDCRFMAQPHTTRGRALIHAIAIGGIDNLTISKSVFHWCDNGLSGESTYDNPSQPSTQTWTSTDPSWSLGSVISSGRDTSVTDCKFYNSSEHAIYLAIVSAVASNNVISVDDPEVCQSDIKVRARGASVTGNVFNNTPAAVSVEEPAYNVQISGNIHNAAVTTWYTGGSMGASPVGIVDYTDNRDWMLNYEPMHSVVFDNNVIVYPDGSASAQFKSGFRFITDGAVPQLPENNQMDSLIVSNNTVRNARDAVWIGNGNYRNCLIVGNTFSSDSLTRSGFNSSTPLNTENVISLFGSLSANALLEFTFNDNHVNGYNNVLGYDANAPTNVRLPSNISGNTFNYIKVFKKSNYRAFTGNVLMQGNYGTFFLDRTGVPDWLGDNSLGNGATTSANENKRILYVSPTDVRLYYDDAGNYVQMI